MLQSMGLQRVGRNLATEKQPPQKYLNITLSPICILVTKSLITFGYDHLFFVFNEASGNVTPSSRMTDQKLMVIVTIALRASNFITCLGSSIYTFRIGVKFGRSSSSFFPIRTVRFGRIFCRRASQLYISRFVFSPLPTHFSAGCY